MNRRVFLLALVGAALAAGCTKDDAPVEPAWGKEPCAHCAMVLSERRFGAQILTRGGDRFFFDDPGCMVVFAQRRGLDAERAWVRDEASGRWVDARGAHYAGGAKSPMDYGFEPSGAGPLAWDDMRARVLAKEKGAP
jgi:hypothetical protein